jgi:16S rRNA G1207 methylase RsmC
MSGRRVLDLGCGYGAIGVVVAASFPNTKVTMVDSSVIAIELARENARLNGVETRTDAILSDGLRDLKGAPFDTVLSHFPLHISKRALTRILNEAHDSLEEGGELYGVALSEYDVRPLLMQVFGNVETISPSDDTGGHSDYRVVRSHKPKKAQIPVRTLHDPVSP